MTKLRLSRIGAVCLYGLALGVIAVILFVTRVSGEPPLAEPQLPWWGIAIGWVIFESCVVHLQFRRSAHSFSLADVPFVFGLMFASGDSFFIGAVVGSAIAYGIRRLPPIKIAFNVAQLALAVCVAFIITRAIAVPGDALEPRTWIALYVATLTTGALTITCIAGAIAITEGGLSLRTLGQMFAMDGVVTAANSSIAIAAAVMISIDARSIPVLLVPVVIVFAMYRAYVSERQRHEKLEFLYEANRALTRSPEVAEAIEGVLARSLDAFRSEVAEVVLFSADGTPLRTTYGPGAERVTMVEADHTAAEELASFVDIDRPVASLAPADMPRHLRHYFQARGIRHVMVGMLPGETRMIGTIMLGNRFGIDRSYSDDDLRLLEVLANNASVALQYDRLEQAVGKLRSLQEQLQHQAYHDPLTDLPNRTLFMDQVQAELRKSADTLAVLFIDVDDFKVVNDSLGHVVGDALLVSVAGRLRHSVRPQDVVARLGGDEFAVMLPSVDDPVFEARNVAARMLRAFEAPVNAGSELVSVNLSIGITDSRRSADADALIRDADLAMYQAKAKGKSRFEFFDPAMAEAMLRRHDIKAELSKAIEREQIVVEYQPIVTLETNKVSAVEALVRWQDPARGLVYPNDFVSLAEETGLIRGIGRHVLMLACRQARAWNDDPSLEAPIRVHVNVSVAELRDPEFIPNVRAMLDEFDLSAEMLALEITESELLGDAKGSAVRFEELRSLGIRISLDDFGTGYSSLSYLHSLPLDSLKIAKPFVDGLVGEGREAGFIGMIVDLARTLELDVIAEGIETATQLEALRALGVELGQGYLLGRPTAVTPGRFRRTTAAVVR